MPSSRRFTFTAAHRMIHRIHGDTPYARPAAQPAGSSRFSKAYVLMVYIPDLPQSSFAFKLKQPDLARRHLYMGESALLRQKLTHGPGRTRDLPSLARLKLQIVYIHTERYFG
jgi:hypothetical protein